MVATLALSVCLSVRLSVLIEQNKQMQSSEAGQLDQLELEGNRDRGPRASWGATRELRQIGHCLAALFLVREKHAHTKGGKTSATRASKTTTRPLPFDLDFYPPQASASRVLTPIHWRQSRAGAPARVALASQLAS